MNEDDDEELIEAHLVEMVIARAFRGSATQGLALLRTTQDRYPSNDKLRAAISALAGRGHDASRSRPSGKDQIPHPEQADAIPNHFATNMETIFNSLDFEYKNGFHDFESFVRTTTGYHDASKVAHLLMPIQNDARNQFLLQRFIRDLLDWQEFNLEHLKAHPTIFSDLLSRARAARDAKSLLSALTGDYLLVRPETYGHRRSSNLAVAIVRIHATTDNHRHAVQFEEYVYVHGDELTSYAQFSGTSARPMFIVESGGMRSRLGSVIILAGSPIERNLKKMDVFRSIIVNDRYGRPPSLVSFNAIFIRLRNTPDWRERMLSRYLQTPDDVMSALERDLDPRHFGELMASLSWLLGPDPV